MAQPRAARLCDWTSWWDGDVTRRKHRRRAVGDADATELGRRSRPYLARADTGQQTVTDLPGGGDLEPRRRLQKGLPSRRVPVGERGLALRVDAGIEDHKDRSADAARLGHGR